MGLDMPGECIVLKEYLRADRPPCINGCVRDLFPSYRDRGGSRPLGCWIAHTALTIIECIRLRPRLRRALKKTRWGKIEMASVLHDFGKLSKPYVDRERGIQHNILSSAIALTTIEDGVLATAIFLHHEAMHWERLYATSIKLFQPLVNSINRKTRITLKNGFKLHERSGDALENLMSILKALDLYEISKVVENVSKREEYAVSVKEFEEKVTSISAFKKALPVYWVLYQADNRAASARDGPEAYWLRPLIALSGFSKEPSKLAEVILRNVKRPDITLTALPRSL